MVTMMKKRGKPGLLTIERNAQIVYLRKRGLTYQEIAAHFGLSRERVSQILCRDMGGDRFVVVTRTCRFCGRQFKARRGRGVKLLYCPETACVHRAGSERRRDLIRSAIKAA